MIARVQQILTLLGVGLALLWLLLHWQKSPTLAVLGALTIGLLHAVILGLEFLLLARFGSADPAPRPTARQLLQAWLQEVRHLPQIYCWQQPFRWQAVPDFLPAHPEPALRGVVLVHGLLCNRGFWNPWMRRLRKAGHPFVAVNLEPIFAPIESGVQTIEQAVRQVSDVTGRPPVLVCHSMGGLAARAWLASPGRTGSAAHVITIGTPHRGTWMARLSRAANGRQMRLGSQWLRRLGQPDLDEQAFTCWYSNCDNIVFPVSTATLEGADNRHVPGVAHVALGFRREVMDETLRLIRLL